VHRAIPEKELPPTPAATGWLYQPPESGGRDGAAETVGVEVSTLIGWLDVVVPAGPLIVQDIVVESSCANECGTHPLVGLPVFGLQFQLRKTAFPYQPGLHGAI
jgi:hypothetical protein